MRTLALTLLLCSTCVGQEWLTMPQTNRQERAEREKARKQWAAQLRATRGIREAQQRKARIAQRKQNGYYDRYHGLGQLRMRQLQIRRSCNPRRRY